MDILNKPNAVVCRFLGQQEREDGIQYRLSRYVVAEGDAMYNTLTGEAIRGADEAEKIRKWFLVPENMDESALAYSIRQKSLQNVNGPGGNIKKRFVIFLTTVCNAHCEYCYEHGIKPMTMTEQTAADVADYILAHSDRDAPPRIRWFGGDPLVNTRAIDIISGRLNSEKMPFRSEAFTNGDLLPDVTDEQLKAWHIDKFQFTVDDIDPDYARVKGLPQGAYERLCDTIDRVTALGIRADVRIHYWPGKGKEIPLRVAKEFCGRERVRPYCVMLYGGGSTEDYAGLMEVQEYIHRHGGGKIIFPVVRFGVSCMADNRKIACITTDGHLSPCEHHPYGENYGSIYGKGYDQAVLKRWAAKSRNYCKGCVLYPSCGKMALCPADGKCTEAEINHMVQRIRFVLRETK